MTPEIKTLLAILRHAAPAIPAAPFTLRVGVGATIVRTEWTVRRYVSAGGLPYVGVEINDANGRRCLIVERDDGDTASVLRALDIAEREVTT
jgi:hypothetical protein